MNINIVCVGSIKEVFFRDAVKEYEKRLSRYCKLNIIEVKDEKTPDSPTENERAVILDKEATKILDKIKQKDYVIALAIIGKDYSSEELADHLSKLNTEGVSDITFVIGGSLGLSENVYKRADERLSFSRFTFPHQLMRVIILEQVYRSFRIRSGEPYHK